MLSKAILSMTACMALVSALACDKATPIEPGSSTSAFAGTWVGVKRLVSCSPSGPMCGFQPVGLATYFSATMTQQGAAVDGSVMLSEPGPLALPYGFTIKGQVSPSAQLTFERVFFQDVGEPAYSGDIAIQTSTRRLTGRMTKPPSTGDNLTLVWEVEAVRR